jgi:Zn-dependent protease with chaperone function
MATKRSGPAKPAQKATVKKAAPKKAAVKKAAAPRKAAATKAAPTEAASKRGATKRAAPTKAAPRTAPNPPNTKTPNMPPPYTGLSVASFQHPADRAATAALTAIPGLDAAVRWLIEQGYERALYQQNLAGSVRLGPDQLPDVYESFLRVLTALDLEGAETRPPTLYVSQNPSFNAITVGSQNPYIVVTSRLVEVLDPKELQVVLGYQVGHILASHVVYHTALQILLGLTIPALSPGSIPLTAIRLALLEWFRAAELTCDRAAVLAVDDPDLVCRTLMVLGGGLPSTQLSYAAFKNQVREYQDWEDGPDRLRRFIALLGKTHGTPVRRASEIVRWVESGEFERIREGDYTRRGDENSAAEATGDAVAHYGERFRDIFSTAGESVAKAGNKIQSWLHSD